MKKGEPIEGSCRPTERLPRHTGAAAGWRLAARRFLIFGAAMLAGIGLVQAQCREGGATALSMPNVTWLRSYRADLTSPTRLAIDGADNVYIADMTRGSVTARALDGSVFLDRRGLGKPASLAVDVGGRIFVGDGEDGRVTAYDSAWSPLFHLGVGAGEFGHPGDIVIDPSNGDVFVSDTARHRVRAYSASGTFLREIGAPSPSVADMLAQPNPATTKAPEGTFRSPTGLALSGAELLIADQMNYRIQAFDKSSGAFLYCVGTYREGGFFSSAGGARPRFFGMVQGIWADGQGRAYIVDSFEGTVRVIDLSTGARLGAIGTFGEDSGALRVPTDVVIDRFGRLFVASADNGRLEVFGVGSFSDPETHAPARLTLEPGRLDRFSPAAQVEARLEVAGYRVADIDRASVRINGLVPLAFSEGDPDGNGVHDLLVSIPGSQLLASLTSATPDAGTVTVSGSVGPLRFSASAVMALTAIPPDTDGDGVQDALDRCPGTVVGSEVDATGCAITQRDDDADGVPNGIDLCPRTPAGSAVDGTGCSATQLDADGDGVPDALDRCPGTPAGSPVDGNGCSNAQLDADGDGVPDAIDQCPGTPASTVVDAAGCSRVQRDADLDGVPNATDVCPGTAPGQVVDAAGCSIAQYCPCDGPRAGGKWRRHGEYVSCVSHNASAFHAAGLIANAGAVVREAARSTCGRNPMSRDDDADEDRREPGEHDERAARREEKKRGNR